MKDFIEGIQYIKGKSDILRSFFLIAVFSLMGMPFTTLLPVFAGEIFRKGPKGFGFLVGATGTGALVAALLLAFKGDIKEKNRFMSFSALSFSILLFIFSFSGNFFFSLAVLVFIGWSLVSFFATANSFIQLSVPDNLRGRAMSVYTFVFLGTAPIGNSLIGTLADSIGTARAVTISALVCLIASGIFSMKISRD